jgi:hypothetical protein
MGAEQMATIVFVSLSSRTPSLTNFETVSLFKATKTFCGVTEAGVEMEKLPESEPPTACDSVHPSTAVPSSAGRAMLKRAWPAHPPAYVFAGDELGAEQGTMVKSVYQDDYDNHQEEIEKGAKIPAYGKPLLSALVLSVLGQKFATFIGLSSPAAPTNIAISGMPEL